MERSSIGQQELYLLNYIADQAPLTVSQAAEDFGVDHNLARTTVLTMMDRLRKKGWLIREQVNGLWYYRSYASKAELQRGLVGKFFTQAMGGSLEPFVAYLTQDAQLTPEEIDSLRAMVKHLDAGK